MANACALVLKAPSELVSGEIYNVGGDNENYTKRELATIIQEFIDDVDIDIISSKKDPRNYKVSFEKIKNVLGFEVKKTVKDSVNEILKEVKSGSLSPQDSEFSNMSKLTEKIKPLISYNFDENL